jgi:hypothetical protein
VAQPCGVRVSTTIVHIIQLSIHQHNYVAWNSIGTNFAFWLWLDVCFRRSEEGIASQFARGSSAKPLTKESILHELLKHTIVGTDNRKMRFSALLFSVVKESWCKD